MTTADRIVRLREAAGDYSEPATMIDVLFVCDAYEALAAAAWQLLADVDNYGTTMHDNANVLRRLLGETP